MQTNHEKGMKLCQKLDGPNNTRNKRIGRRILRVWARHWETTRDDMQDVVRAMRKDARFKL
jgi:hypothetical protein